MFGKVEAMGWLRRICPQHMSAVCAALHSAKDCHCAGCAGGRIAVATCSLNPDFDAPMRSLDCRHPNSFSLEKAERYIAE